MNLIPLKCPNCNASIEINPNLKQCYCNACGTPFVYDDGSIVIKTEKRIIDEARIKEAEIELEKKKIDHKEGAIALLFLLFIILLSLYMGFIYY